MRELAAFLYRYSGIPVLIRTLFCRRAATIIFYHNPPKEIFRAHVAYLKARYAIIPLPRLVDAIHKRDFSAIPKNALVITFDDGFAENADLAEILKENRIHATFYVCAGIAGTRRQFWFKAPAVKQMEKRRLKSVPNRERLRILAQAAGFVQEREAPRRQALDETQLKAMAEYADIGAHTLFHPILPMCDDRECASEIRDSKTILEGMIGGPVEHFAYPNGDYGPREIRLLEQNGYRSGRTLDIGFNGVGANPFCLKAMGVEDRATVNVLSAQVTGFFGLLRHLKSGRLSGRRPAGL